MTDGFRAPPGPPHPGEATDQDRVRALDEVRALLLGREQRALADLTARFDALELTPDEVAGVLAEAFALRAGSDDQLARALGPTLENAFSESVQRNPHQLAEVIYPTLGPAIRKSIAEAISDIVQGINRGLQESFSMRGLKWRIEAWRSGVPYAQIVLRRALVYRVEQVYLIHAETGLLLAYVTAPDLKAPDADVISGMLTAIRDFVSDSFDQKASGGLRTFTVGDVTMLVEPGPRALLAVAVRGHHPASLLTRLQATLETIHFQFARPLANFEGDNAPFEAAKPLLAECLETVLDTDQPKTKSTVLRVAWGAAAVVLVALIAWGVVSTRSWHRAQRVLASEPGIVVLQAHRGLFGWRFSGLKDPLARHPRVVLAAAGFDSTREHGMWVPYVSADSGVVVSRARRFLFPPATVTLALLTDTIMVRGVATTGWLDSIGSPAIPGVAVLRTDQVQLALPAALVTTQSAIDTSRIFFAVGSSELSEEASRTLGVIARSWRTLQAGVGSAWTVTINIVGRTDTTGTEEMNRTLSDDRARAAARVLAGLGVSSAALASQGIGTSNPLAAPDRTEQARRNRSASFEVRLRHLRRAEDGR